MDQLHRADDKGRNTQVREDLQQLSEKLRSTCDDSCTRRLCQVGDSRRCYGVAIVFQGGFADTGSDPGTPVLEALSSCDTLAKWALVCRDKIQSACLLLMEGCGFCGLGHHRQI